MAKIKKEIVYTMPYISEKDIKRANEKRFKLFQKFNCVQLCPNGSNEVRIIATNN